MNGRLLVTTENNGTRLYQFADGGKIDPKPVATNKKLAPDTHTPMVTAGRVFGVWKRLYALDVKNGLKEAWDSDDKAFHRYTALVATDQLALAVSLEGELVLFDPTADEFEVLSRLKVFASEKGLYSHPAFVGKRVYVRGSSAVVCLDLGG